MAHGDDVKLFDVHQGLTGRDGGPYLDQIERIEAEKRRAVIEDREPDDLTKPEQLTATAGTPLVTGAQLVAMANPASNPSMQGADPIADAITTVSQNDDFPVNVHSERPDISSKPDEPRADKTDPSNPTLGSKDPEDDKKDKDPLLDGPTPESATKKS